MAAAGLIGLPTEKAGSVSPSSSGPTHKSNRKIGVRVTNPQLGTVEYTTIGLEDIMSTPLSDADMDGLYFGSWKDVCFFHGIRAEDAKFASEMVWRVGQQTYSGLEAEAVLGARAASSRSHIGKVSSLTGIMWLCAESHPDPWELLRVCVIKCKSNRGYGGADGFLKALTEFHQTWQVEKRICAGCGTPSLAEKLQKCDGCKVVHYCGRECQKQHWPAHKKICCLLRTRKLQERKLESEDPSQVRRASTKISCIKAELEGHVATQSYNPFKEASGSLE